jgi:hypothetical protein
MERRAVVVAHYQNWGLTVTSPKIGKQPQSAYTG